MDIKKLAGNVTPRRLRGFALTSELVLVSTITVLGVTAGLVALRDATMAELHDLSEAVGALNQSYAYQGIDFLGTDATLGSVAGSIFLDDVDSAAGDRVGWSFTAVSGTYQEASEFSLGGVPVGDVPVGDVPPDPSP